ncbi:hypothetical protein Tco_1215375 [Tanacetum coccineum]
MKQLNKEIKSTNYAKINQLLEVCVFQKAKTTSVSKSISILNEEFSDDTSPKANESLAKEADESLAKHKTLEYEIERLLRAVVIHDIMSIVQNNHVVYTSNLQTELERTKERFENYVIKNENEYAKLWNDWYKKYEECKYDKISYDKAYNDMQQKIERLQAQLGDLKGKSQDTPCVSDTLDPLSQKLENENVELEFQVKNTNNLMNQPRTRSEMWVGLLEKLGYCEAPDHTAFDTLEETDHEPKRTLLAATNTTNAPMSATAINQLIKTRVAEALANQEIIRNSSTNGDGSQNSRSGMGRPAHTPREPKTMQEAIKLANDLMDQKGYTYAERQAKNKRKQEDNSRSNQNQQQPFKK